MAKSLVSARSEGELALLGSREDGLSYNIVSSDAIALTAIFTHKSISHLHGTLISLLRVGGDVEVPDDHSDSHSQDDLGKVLATADTSTNPERDQLLGHTRSTHQHDLPSQLTCFYSPVKPVLLSIRTVDGQPPLGKEGLRAGEDLSVTMHAPSLS